MYIYIYILSGACIRKDDHEYMHQHIHACMHTYFVHRLKYVHMSMPKCRQTHEGTNTQANNMHKNTHIHTHTHTHTQSLSLSLSHSLALSHTHTHTHTDTRTHPCTHTHTHTHTHRDMLSSWCLDIHAFLCWSSIWVCMCVCMHCVCRG